MSEDFELDPIHVDEVKQGFTHLHLPEDLSGKTVLELFSGGESDSMRNEIEQRG